MARVEVKVVGAYRCPHCEQICIPDEIMFKHGIETAIHHVCGDGTIEKEFTDAVAWTTIEVVMCAESQRSLEEMR